MQRKKFPLSSDQMELLLAFESAGSLEKLADLMARDPSVVSRNLQKLAAEAPVIAKVSGRWHITPFGRQLNRLSLEHLDKLDVLIGTARKKKAPAPKSLIPSHSVLIVINAQKALHDSAQGRRSNLSAEQNIVQMLEHWRTLQRPIIHVKHVSENAESFFFKKSPGAEFFDGLEPNGNEVVLEKKKSSAFTGTRLEKILRSIQPASLVLVGFTAGECIDATARQASDGGFKTFVIGDATATFDIVSPNGQLHKATKLHKTVLANLQALFAEVIETDVAVRS